jgi:hypothetical protein
MAVIAPAAWYGLGALVAAAVMIPVIYALARLRRNAPVPRRHLLVAGVERVHPGHGDPLPRILAKSPLS